MNTTIEFLPSEDNPGFGALCVCWAMPENERPVMVKTYYPIFTSCRRADYADYIGLAASPDYPGVYVAYLDNSPIKFGLVNRGETLPILTISEDVPPPKRVKEYRWWYGHWEKYTRSGGWQVVY